MNARKTYVAPELELFEVRSEERFTASGCRYLKAWDEIGCPGTEGTWVDFDANSGGSL